MMTKEELRRRCDDAIEFHDGGRLYDLFIELGFREMNAHGSIVPPADNRSRGTKFADEMASFRKAGPQPLLMLDGKGEGASVFVALAPSSYTDATLQGIRRVFAAAIDKAYRDGVSDGAASEREAAYVNDYDDHDYD